MKAITVILSQRLHDQLVESLNAGEQVRVCGTLLEHVSGRVATLTGLHSDQEMERPVIASSISGPDTPYTMHIRQDGSELAFMDNRTGEVCHLEFYDEAQDFFKRTPLNEELQQELATERVAIVGVGSVGAQLALSLASAGVGSILLIDNDVLEVHNCSRHVLGTAHIGWPKAKAVQAALKEQSPLTEVVAVDEDLFVAAGKEGCFESRQRLKQVISDYHPARLIAATDSRRVQNLVQLLALNFDLPYAAIGCDSNAIEGEIFFWGPGQAEAWKPGREQRACYACLRPPGQDQRRSAHFDYSEDDPDTAGGEPALGSFIDRITLTGVMAMLGWMLKGRDTGLGRDFHRHFEGLGLQYLRVGGPYPMPDSSQLITASQPWAVEWKRVKKQEACPFCSRDLQELEPILFPPAISQEESDGGFESI